MIKSKFAKWFCKSLPKKGRKTVYLTTLFMKLNQIKPGDLKAMQEFNNTLHVVDDLKALKIPCQIYRSIWRDVNIPKLRDDADIQDEKVLLRLGKEILSMDIGIKKYDDDKHMLEDIIKIIKYTVNRHNGHLPHKVFDSVHHGDPYPV